MFFLFIIIDKMRSKREYIYMGIVVMRDYKLN